MADPYIVADYLPHFRLARFDTNVSLPRAVELECDLLLPGSGWYAPETCSSGWFRWLGPRGVGTVNLMVDRSVPLRFEARVHLGVMGSIVGQIRLRCDGRPVATTVSMDGDTILIGGELPVRLGSQEPITEVAICAPYDHVMEGEGGRILRMSFSRFTVSPAHDSESVKSDTLWIAAAVHEDLQSEAETLYVKDVGTMAPQIKVGGAIVLASSDDQTSTVRFGLVKVGQIEGELTCRFACLDPTRVAVTIERDAISGPIRPLMGPFHGDAEQGHYVEYIKRRRSGLDTWDGGHVEDASSLQAAICSELVETLTKDGTNLPVASGVDRKDWLAFVALLGQRIVVDFGRSADDLAATCTMRGFSHVETWERGKGRWTDGPRAEIVLVHPVQGTLDLTIDLPVIFGPNIGGDLIVEAGGEQVRSTLQPGVEKVEIRVEANACVDLITIIPPAPTSPASFMQSADSRVLGVGIARLTIEHAA